MNRAALARANLTLRILPPRGGCSVFPVPRDYEEAIAAVQRLRGRVYVAEGALPAAALTDDGRHQSDLDEKSYHLALWNGQMEGCLRLTLYSAEHPLEDYKIYDLIRRMPEQQAPQYHQALKNFLDESRAFGLSPGETGGLAISDVYRMNAAALAVPLAGWSLSQIHKRQVWIATATERNASGEILRRLGGWRLKLDGQELLPFFDSAYGCKMEFVCFDSDTLNPKFAPQVAELRELMLEQARRDRMQ